MESVADTGFEKVGHEPDPSAFAAAEDCGTQMWIGLWASDAEEPNWKGAWAALQKLEIPHDGTRQPVKSDDVLYAYEYLHVDVADLTDPNATEKALFRPLREWLGMEG